MPRPVALISQPSWTGHGGLPSASGGGIGRGDRAPAATVADVWPVPLAVAGVEDTGTVRVVVVGAQATATLATANTRTERSPDGVMSLDTPNDQSANAADNLLASRVRRGSVGRRMVGDQLVAPAVNRRAVGSKYEVQRVVHPCYSVRQISLIAEICALTGHKVAI
jgi:hypothetical protein